MYSMVIKRLASRISSTSCFSTHTKVWDLFPTPGPAKPEAPQYLMIMKDNLDFALERMRLIGRPVALQLLHRNARRPKKANHGKRPCSHYRRRLKRLGRRSDN
ncbi:hypothetical protein KXD40_002987 [Peronospora effusa]|uniref:Uncharacterized protein n=1 Tax=Peronospora effusa TaxID=542832 RepID=A0A3M6VEI0_9STRA|nr:hypothetical protein DD238_005975 [Peronospora effusa]RQM16445.1 hypothetical protein DD237_003360 [Peronospora effusa]UIZ29445.1 hypothetical protein KXD40_002987 [Peronospora effusa]